MRNAVRPALGRLARREPAARPANQNAPGRVSRTILRFGRRPRTVRGDLEFLPAALEILETPASPVHTALMLSICVLAATALAWAYLGRIDIVAVAQGKFQPSGRVKVVQPLETGRVRAILAENGTRVQAGDPLIELDATEARADEAGLRASLSAYKAEAVRRGEAIRAAEAADLDTPRVPRPAAIFAPDAPSAIRTRETRVLAGDLGQLAASLESLTEQAVQKAAERARLRATIAAQSALIATLRERVTMRATLVERSAGTKAAVIDATESLQYHAGTLATQVGQLAEAEAGLRVLARERHKVRDAFVAENGQRLAEAERQADDLEQRLAKASERVRRMTLLAPLGGTVQASSVTTVGQVVMPGEELMRIVPEGSAIEIEAYLPNKDIGFVHSGQEVTIKVEAFPFTRYGTLTGTVTRVATDAIPEPDAQQVEGSPARSGRSLGLVGGAQRTQNLMFPVTVRPSTASIAADGAPVAISPGMAAMVEVKTGRRRILEYLFSPVVEIVSGAIRER